MKTYNLFISHSWEYGGYYENLIKMLRLDCEFDFRDFSVPRNDHIHILGTDEELYEAIRNQMHPCHIIIILSGVHITYSRWINKEVQIAKKEFNTPKPILSIRPWGQVRIFTVGKELADGICNWNASSIIGKIKELAIPEGRRD